MNWGKFHNFIIRKRKLILAAFLLFILAALIVAFFINRSNQREKDQGTNLVQREYNQETSQTPRIKETPPDLHENQERSKISGQWIDKSVADNVPVAVMFSNIEAAMPQSSIGSADIVLESLVEGGITRLCGVFENCTNLVKIGPVRSCRTYYLLFAKEFEAIYVHFGYSEYAKPYLQDPKMHSLDGMVYGDFYRSTDRVAPHNAYTSWEGIMKSATAKKYPVTYPEGYRQPFRFNEDDEKEIQPEGQRCLQFEPGYQNNSPYFTYNQSDGQYYRYQFGGPQTDEQTDQQLRYKNIIVRYVDGKSWPNGTPDYNLTGSGKGLFITNGVATEITWVHDSKQKTTAYFYPDGNEVLLNQGKTWVCLIDGSHKGTVKVRDNIGTREEGKE